MVTQQKLDYRANFYTVQIYKGSVIDSVNREKRALESKPLDQAEKTIASLKSVKGLGLW